jgi:hypothetical protein
MSTLPRMLGVNGASGEQLHLCPNCGVYVIAATSSEFSQCVIVPHTLDLIL